jgi:hypothetical protein
MRPWNRLAMVAGCVLTMALQHAAAQDASGDSAGGISGNDLRDIRIGMAVADLPSAGYADFSCTADAERKLTGWSDWRDCPAGADGLRALRFGYDPATSRDGTVVAGHPAVLTALIDNAGTVAGLKIETDPKARLYLRKKAFLFGPQVKARYGSDGWACTQAQLDAGEQPVGGVYVKERCTKTVQGRALVIERNLFRQAGQDEKSFVDETRVTILRASS